MKNLTNTPIQMAKYLAFSSILAFSSSTFAASLNALVDDFNHSTNNNLGVQRQFMNDTVAGGNTSAELNIAAGVMHYEGDIVPARGQPGWASSVLLLDPQGLPKDASAFVGVELKIKVNKGNLSLSANSTEITNFDYHAATIVTKNDGKFHTVKVPFTSMKRLWSEQTELNKATINSLSITAFDLQQGTFDFEVDEVRFY